MNILPTTVNYSLANFNQRLGRFERDWETACKEQERAKNDILGRMVPKDYQRALRVGGFRLLQYLLGNLLGLRSRARHLLYVV